MVETITLTGEINLGQIAVIFSILSTGITFYVKSRLDLQRLNIQHSAVKADISEIKSDMKAQNSALHALQIQVASVQATTGFHQEIGNAISRLSTTVKANHP